MSAGGLSYSGISNYGKAILPSAESWGTNMNILRDPPKSIMTRKIDKVGENSSITTMIDESADRACEAIQVYARGVNPSVSVSYSNYGNNGGQGQAGSLAGLTVGGGIQAKLPYRIMKDGAFRPPIRRQEDLLPLSRQHRISTAAFTKPGFADFSRKLRTCGTAENTKEVFTNKLVTSVRPTATYKIQKPLERPSETKYAVKNTIKNEVNSGMRTMDLTQQHVLEPTKEIQDSPMHVIAKTNMSDKTRYVGDNNNMDTTRYIQEAQVNNVVSNVSSKVGNHTFIDDILDLSNMPIKDISVTEHTAPESRVGDGTTYIHAPLERERRMPTHMATTNMSTRRVNKSAEYDNEIILERNTPMTEFTTNHGRMGDGYQGSREAKLTPKISAGGYDVPGQKSGYNRIQDEITLGETARERMNKQVSESMYNKFSVGMQPF